MISNHNDFHRYGFFATDVRNLDSFNNMWNAVLTDSYIYDDIGTKPIRYPVWERGFDEGSIKKCRTFDDRWTDQHEKVPYPHWVINDQKWEWQPSSPIPEEYQLFTKDILGMLGGKYNHVGCMLHNTLINYVNPWHNHFLDGSKYNVLIHMGYNRTDTDGGKLELGKIVEDEEKYLQYVRETKMEKASYSLPLYAEEYTVRKLGEVSCDHGDVTILDNTNLFNVHRVTQVRTVKPRYTLLLSIGNI